MDAAGRTQGRTALPVGLQRYYDVTQQAQNLPRKADFEQRKRLKRKYFLRSKKIEAESAVLACQRQAKMRPNLEFMLDSALTANLKFLAQRVCRT
jgi:hypothetical protein